MTDNIKPLGEQDLQRAEFAYRQWLCEIDLSRVPFESLFRSSFWGPHAKRLAKNDLLRIRSTNGSLDVLLVVSGKIGDKLTVTRYPRVPKEVHEAATKAVAAIEDNRKKVRA